MSPLEQSGICAALAVQFPQKHSTETPRRLPILSGLQTWYVRCYEDVNQNASPQRIDRNQRQQLVSARFQKSSTPPSGLSQSQWWIRMASFSTETGRTQRLNTQATDRKPRYDERSSAIKRGFRKWIRRPLSLRLINR